MSDSTLSLLTTEVRGKTLRLLNNVSEEQARFTGHPRLNNSILWHAGHCFVVTEYLCVAPATERPPAYPDGFAERFAPNSRPAEFSTWPTLSEIVERLRDQQERLLASLAVLAPQRFDQVIDADRNRTLRFSILHGLHDEAMHQGEISLLKKLSTRL